MLNGAKVTGERLNDPFFEKMKSTGIEIQWSNPSFLVTHEKSIIVDGKSALLPTFNFMEKHFRVTDCPKRRPCQRNGHHGGIRRDKPVAF
jgi:hypothetical protein